MTDWLILTATLPTKPSALRVRVWRNLKATGAGTLREGVYLLPTHAPSAPALWELERTIAEAGAQAHLLQVQARDAAQEAAFQALFDRADLYGELLQSIKEARSSLARAADDSLQKQLRQLEQQLQSIRNSDFFPGKPAEKTAAALAALRREIELKLCPDEPAARPAALRSLAVADHQGRTWATRRRPWMDRLASAWLISRFIDAQPHFLWLSDARRCPKSALGYDFDGASFSHVGELVTFEVMAASFALNSDPALQRLGALVHYIDVGGIPVEEAPGLERLVRGLQAQHADDDQLLQAALPLFDALYIAFQNVHEPD